MYPIGGFILAIVVLLCCQDSTTLRPDITTEADEIIKNEGDPLEIICSGTSKLFFVYPNESGELVNTSTPVINEYKDDAGTYRYEFRRPETVHGDTGWYGCADYNVEVTHDSYFDPDISWVYVYVQSNTSFFVEQDSFRSLREAIGGTVTIPCRPTSPNLTVSITSEDTDLKSSDRLSFDPRFGFTLSNLTLKDIGYLKCVIEKDNTYREVNYLLYVHRRQMLQEPKILEDTLSHVTRGQTLRVKCTIDVEDDMHYFLYWKTPQNDSRISTHDSSTKYGTNVRRATNELVIEGVLDEDEGLYECIIQSFHAIKKSEKYIKVHDPEKTFINLTTEDTNTHYRLKYGDRVQWVVKVDAYPTPQLKWLDPKGVEIEGSWESREKKKHAINKTFRSTALRINHLNINDMGIYSLQASNQDRIEMLNFTLEVITKPIPCIVKKELYYAPKQIAQVHCEVAAFPMPNVTWSYLKCPYYPSCENATMEILTDVHEEDMMTSFRSKANVTIEMSGNLTCTACNSAGCDSVMENILVSDGEGGFGLIEPKGLVTEGDTIELICVASVYNYSSKFKWRNIENTPILENKRLTIHQADTQFTHRSILKIKNVTKEDSKSYRCSVTILPDNMAEESVYYFLHVYDAQAPLFTKTNMENNEVIIDLNVQNHKAVVLQCYAHGMPIPKITWYKDDVMLTNNKQYMIVNDSQELCINYLLENNNGKYLCLVENRLGKLEAYQQITLTGKALPKTLIISIVILVIILIIVLVYFRIKVRREESIRKELMEAGLTHFEEGAVECLNPDLTVDDQAELLPYDRKWEFPRERLKLGKKLGSGAFGVVMKAEAQGICEDEPFTTVAVKMVRRTADPTYVRALASELKIMVYLRKHLNVVNLLGACTKNISKRELLVIVEYCRFGNLHNYLLRHRADFINQIDSATSKFDPSIGMDLLAKSVSINSDNRIKYAALSFSRSLSTNSGTDSVHYQGPTMDSQGVSMSPDGCILSNNLSQPGWRSNYRGDYKDHNLKPICTQDLLSWAFQVARGMEYLSQRKVLHGDLAARNILLAENNVVKICDFGLAKTMYKDDNYRKKGDGPLPIKWMAIESIRDRIFSTQSDIWSFGIVLWEFFTLAKTPYPGMEAEKQYQKLIEGYRMEQPEYATFEVYDIMLQCWKTKPTLRPSFTELVDSIGDLLEESVRAHYVSLNTPYMDMNTLMLEEGKNDYLAMLSAPDHAILSSPGHEYTNSPRKPADSAYLCMSPTNQTVGSRIFSPTHQEHSHFEFPSPTSDTEDAVEMSPMLKKVEDDDPYLKPINVQERRAEFARNRLTVKDRTVDQPIDRDSGYCNAPQNLQLIDLNEKNKNSNESNNSEKVDETSKKDFVPSIIRTQDNYVNMPKQRIDLRKDMPDGFSNPSYVLMGNREVDQTRV